MCSRIIAHEERRLHVPDIERGDLMNFLSRKSDGKQHMQLK